MWPWNNAVFSSPQTYYNLWSLLSILLSRLCVYFNFFNLNLFIFNWKIIALQYCVGFCHISTRTGQRYMYVFSLLILPHTHPTPRGCPMRILLNGSICSRSLLELWSDSVYKPYKKTSVIPLYAHYFQNNIPPAWLPTIYMGCSFRKTFNTFPQEIHPLKMTMCHIWRYLRQRAKSVHIGF